MAKQRMLICGSVLLDDIRPFYINDKLDPTFEELFIEETQFLNCLNIYAFMKLIDTVMMLGMIDTNTVLYQSQECVGNVHSTSNLTETVIGTVTEIL